MSTSPSTLAAVVTILVSLAAIALVTRFRMGAFLSPMSLSLLMLVSIFGVRPLLMVRFDDYSFYGADVRSGFELATSVGFWAVLALCGGYALGLTGHPQPLSYPPPRAVPALVRFRWGMVAAVSLVLAWFGAMIVVGGGVSFVATLFNGRSAVVGDQLNNVPAIIPALPVVGALVAAITRVRLQQLRALTRGENLCYWLVIALAVVPPSALGTRRFLLPSLVAGALGVVTAGWFRRISFRSIALALFGFVALAVMPFVRSAGSRTGSTDLPGAMSEYFQSQGILGVSKGFFLSYDTEMFNYVAYLGPRLGVSIPFGQGRAVIGDAFLAPIPASMAPFTSWSDQLLTTLFGGGCAEVLCPVPSLPGLLFFDLGHIGVAVGMFVVGLACSRFETSFLSFSPRTFAFLLVLAAFTIQMVRGNPVSQAWIAFQVWVLVAVIERIVIVRFPGRRALRRAGRRRQELAGRPNAAHPNRGVVWGLSPPTFRSDRAM